MLDSPKLTARQQQILDLIQSAISRTGAPPTRAEIATELGFKHIYPIPSEISEDYVDFIFYGKGSKFL